MKTPPWLKIAFGENGVHEVDGANANPRILLYHAITTLRATSDEIAWCSAFVCWCLEISGVRSTRSAAARSYLNWGKAIDKPEVGCVVIISRGGDPTQGHVGFWIAENDEHVFIHGGNQNNMVCLEAFHKGRVVGYRMPLEKDWNPGATH